MRSLSVRKETRLFAIPFSTKDDPFYQDRLGTDIGKALIKREMRFLAGVLIREKPRLKALWQDVHADEATITINAAEVRNRISFAMPFYPTNDRFTKTGSGQT